MLGSDNILCAKHEHKSNKLSMIAEVFCAVLVYFSKGTSLHMSSVEWISYVVCNQLCRGLII